MQRQRGALIGLLLCLALLSANLPVSAGPPDPTLDPDSSTARPGERTLMRSPSRSSAAIFGSADILLIQTNDPWEWIDHYVGDSWYDGITSDTQVLDGLEYTYDVADWDDISIGTVNIFSYPVVLIVNDQVQEFYDSYAAHVTQFENYIATGRTLVFFAAGWGWAGGELDARLPGGVKWNLSDDTDAAWLNTIVNASHPIVTAELSDGIPLTNSDLYSNYCSHGWFSSLPVGSDVILRESAAEGGHPTLIEYAIGQGKVIASTLTWEHNWSYHTGGDEYGTFARKALDDVFLYAFSGGITPADNVQMSLHIEDAPAGVMVNKVAGDSDGLAKKTYVDIVAKIISYDSNIANNVAVTLTVPSALLGNPTTSVRTDSTDTDRVSVGYDNVGNGQYKVTTNLSPILPWWWASGGSIYVKQIVWRFEIPDSPQKVQVEAEMGVPTVSLSESQATAQLRIVDHAQTIIIANRTLLYSEYDYSQVNELLRQMYTIAQGPPRNRSPLPVVYYIDRYSEDARNWDRSSVDHSDPVATINWAADEIDDLIEDWYFDSTEYVTLHIDVPTPWPIITPKYLAIVGDDNVIPFVRQDDPTFTNTEKMYLGGMEAILDDVVANNYFFTENKYADINDTDWEKGDIQLAVGRIVGESATDMTRFLQRATLGPRLATNNAVIASYFEHDPIIPGANNDAVDALRDERGFNILNDTETPPTIQNDNWTEKNLTDAMANGFGIFWFWGHGYRDHISTPMPEEGMLHANEIGTIDASGILNNNRPLWGLSACRTGFSYGTEWEKSLVYSLIHHGASGVVACPGLYQSHRAANQIDWNEKIANDLWQEAIDGTGQSKPIGLALRNVKRNYDAGARWDGFDRKAVMLDTLFGLPWMRIPGRVAGGQDIKRDAITGQNVLLSHPAEISTASAYSITAEIDASNYTIDTTTAPGFDLIQVSGMRLLENDDAPILPGIDVNFALPPGASIVDIVVTPGGETDLGTLNIPLCIPDVAIEGEETGGYKETPDTVGIYPDQLYQVDITPQESFQAVRLTVIPAIYDATSGQATLYQSLSVQVTYEAPLEVAITDFSTDKTSYAPGETINTNATVANVGANSAWLTATLTIKDAAGQTVATQTSSPFTVPGGGAYTLPLAWAGTLDEGAYNAVLTISDGANTLGGVSTDLSILGGEITDFTVPDTVFGYANFQVTFANHRTAPVNVTKNIYIYNVEGTAVARLPQKIVTVSSASETTTSFSWDTTRFPESAYTAAVIATVDGAQYGPMLATFRVDRNAVYLPLVLHDIMSASSNLTTSQ